MKKILSVAVVLVMMLSVLTLGIAATDAVSPEVPDIPEGVYSVKDSAIKLTNEVTVGTTTQASKAVRIVPAMAADSLDISGKQYIYVWIYVSDETMLYDNNGDGIELCSGGNRDTEESAMYFYYDKAIVPTINYDYAQLDRGWNEYLLKLDDFMVDAGGSCDRTRLNYVGFVMRSKPEGLTFAIGPLYAVNMEDLNYDPSKVTTVVTEDTTPEETLPPLVTEPVTTPVTTEAPTPTTPETTTVAPDPTPKDTTTVAPDSGKQGGCGSVVAATVLFPVALFGAAVVVRRRK